MQLLLAGLQLLLSQDLLGLRGLPVLPDLQVLLVPQDLRGQLVPHQI